MALPMVTQPELVRRLAEDTGYSQSEIRVTLTALNAIVEDAVVNCERVKLANVIIEPALRKATKRRMGRNPQTGESVEIAARPASVRIKLTATKPIKEAVPSVQKLKRKLAA